MLPHSHLLNMENEKLREHAEEIVSHMVGPEMTKLGRGSKKNCKIPLDDGRFSNKKKKYGLKTLDFA